MERVIKLDQTISSEPVHDILKTWMNVSQTIEVVTVHGCSIIDVNM